MFSVCFASLFIRTGFALIMQLGGYFLIVLLALLVQWSGVYSLMLKLLANINPLTFLRAMLTPITFAFSVASSNASIPIVLKTVEEKLGVQNKIASLIIPLGATINMDGTAIMQGVATVFIAHAYGIDIGFKRIFNCYCDGNTGINRYSRRAGHWTNNPGNGFKTSAPASRGYRFNYWR